MTVTARRFLRGTTGENQSNNMQCYCSLADSSIEYNNGFTNGKISSEALLLLLSITSFSKEVFLSFFSSLEKEVMESNSNNAILV